MRRLFSLIFILFCAAPAYSLFEDTPADAHSLGLSNAVSAYENFSSFKANPALAGGERNMTTGVSYLYGAWTGQGEKKYKDLGLSVLYPERVMTRNLTCAFSYEKSYGTPDERTLYLGFSSWHLLEGDGETLDFGLGFKSFSVSSKTENKSALGLDAGSVLRTGPYSLGLSFLNLNSPSFKGQTFSDTAPGMMKFGVARKEEDYSLLMDVTRRSSRVYGKSYSIAAGMENYWRTYRGGVFRTACGISLGDNSSSFSLGGGYKNGGGELNVSFAVPFTAPFAVVSGVSLTMRFGERDIENEYEKIVKREMRYRRDLMKSLDEGEKREADMKKELLSMKEEVNRLKTVLSGEKLKREEVEDAKKRVDALLERQRKAQEELRLMEEKRRQDALKRVEDGFSSDWEGYLKLKSSNAGPEALKAYLQRVIGQYQGRGIDISPATLEMQNLVK